MNITLGIANVKPSDAGTYYIRANNSEGQVYKEIRLNVQPRTSLGESTTTCCQRMNVSAGCQGICALSIDLDFLLYKPECFPDFHKIMECASGE